MKTVQQKIKAAALAVGRDPGNIKLVAVSKGKSEKDVRAAMAAGHTVFGENRVQEAKSKFAPLRRLCPALELHLIGPLQTNKTEDAVELFDAIDTLDRPKLAEALAAAIKKIGHAPKLCVEINIGLEPQKSGIAPGELERFLHFCRVSCGLVVDGLMCIPPHGEDPVPYFMQLRELAKQHNLPRLSMGMSADFEKAIGFGATEVRVGTLIFGARAKSD
jgi:pyridoxal phosphate enzyme (YggS family)